MIDRRADRDDRGKLTLILQFGRRNNVWLVLVAVGPVSPLIVRAGHLWPSSERAVLSRKWSKDLNDRIPGFSRAFPAAV